jgi:hypothetical protein
VPATLAVPCLCAQALTDQNARHTDLRDALPKNPRMLRTFHPM